LFKNKESKRNGTAAFTVEGWKNWNIGDNALLKHARSKAHKAAKRNTLVF
jgi:hypothetical protein